MKTILLLVFSLLLAAVAYPYLTYRKLLLNNPAEIAEAEEQAKPSPTWSEVMTALRGNKRLMLYCAAMFAALSCIAVLFVTVYENNRLLTDLRLLFLLAVIFTAAAVDFWSNIIPNELILTALGARVLFWIGELVTLRGDFRALLLSDFLACLIVVALFLIGVVIVKSGLGMGDIKLLLVMCLFQGFYGAVSSIFCSLLVAFFISIIALITKKKTRKDTLPFAPAILAGTYLSVFLTGM